MSFRRLQQLDLEQPGPPLAGDEQAPALGIVGDPVQHAGPTALLRGEQPLQVDPSEHLAVGRGDAGDAIGLPDVGIDLPLDELELSTRPAVFLEPLVSVLIIAVLAMIYPIFKVRRLNSIEALRTI